MEFSQTSNADVTLNAPFAPLVEAALLEAGFRLQRTARGWGIFNPVVMISVAVPSIETLARLVEELRLLMLSRTYICPRPCGPGIRIDEKQLDGRVLVARPDGTFEELDDGQIDVATLRKALLAS